MERNDPALHALTATGITQGDHDLRTLTSAALKSIRALMGASAPESASPEWQVFCGRLALALDDVRADRPRLFTDALRDEVVRLCAEASARELIHMADSRVGNVLRYGARPFETESDAQLLARLLRVVWPDRLLGPDGLLSGEHREEFLGAIGRADAARALVREGLNAHPAVNALMLQALLAELERDGRHGFSPTANLCRMTLAELAGEGEGVVDGLAFGSRVS